MSAPKTKGSRRLPKAEEKMAEKVVLTQERDEDSLMARVIGLGLILLGVVLISLVIAASVLSRRGARINDDINVPSLEASRVTNEQEVSITGEAPEGSRVQFFLNGEEVDKTAQVDDDGNYSYLLEIGDEGDYEIQAAAVRGFPLRERSKKSDVIEVTVDRTPPSSDVAFDYDPISTDGNFRVTGTADPNSTVILNDGSADYASLADDDGKFVIDGIKLESKETEFTVIVADSANNFKELALKIDAEYPSYVAAVVEDDPADDSSDSDEGGDLNGPGVSDQADDSSTNSDTNDEDGDHTPVDTAGGAATTDTDSGKELPEAAGELEAAMEFILGNQLISLFAVIALTVFLANSGVVVYKLGKQN